MTIPENTGANLNQTEILSEFIHLPDTFISTRNMVVIKRFHGRSVNYNQVKTALFYAEDLLQTRLYCRRLSYWNTIRTLIMKMVDVTCGLLTMNEWVPDTSSSSKFLEPRWHDFSVLADWSQRCHALCALGKTSMRRLNGFTTMSLLLGFTLMLVICYQRLVFRGIIQNVPLPYIYILEFFTNCKLLTAGSPITNYYIMADMISCSLFTMASMPLLLYCYLPNAIK